ncbi:hypothetical protein FLM9_688, partial [Candidatus Synechococcus spongiarum]
RGLLPPVCLTPASGVSWSSFKVGGTGTLSKKPYASAEMRIP